MTYFDTMDTVVKQFFDHPAFNRPNSLLAYCDYIATVISKELKANDTERLLAGQVTHHVVDLLLGHIQFTFRSFMISRHASRTLGG